MAILALVGGGNVLRGFAACGTAVVTTGAIAADAAVIEAGVGPGVGAVTVAAQITALHMTGGFPGGLGAIVATAAAAAYFKVVKTCYLRPGINRVAGLAVVAAADVVNGLGRGIAAAAADVTGLTGGWRTLEHATGMTAFTIGGTVRAGQGEAAAEVVEGLGRRRGQGEA